MVTVERHTPDDMPATRLRQSAMRLAAGVNGKATRHSPTGDAGLTSAEFRTDSTCVAKATTVEPVAPRLGAGCFTLRIRCVEPGEVMPGNNGANGVSVMGLTPGQGLRVYLNEPGCRVEPLGNR